MKNEMSRGGIYLKEPDIKKYDLEFRELYSRRATDYIIIHHTGNDIDDDLSAEEIHRIHKINGWSGIGYHFVIRKNGQIEKGRPLWTQGSHCLNYNPISIGIHLSGNFNIGKPTHYQIESLAYLIGWLCEQYGLSPYGNVVGHRDFNATECPGDNLYDMLDEICGKADWYMNNYKDGD